MKAGVAVQLKLAAELTDPRVDITWMWYDHEEVEASLNGLGRVARLRPDLFEADFAILGEPSNGQVEGGCNGTLRVVARTHGVRAHSARAWVGRTPSTRRLPSSRVSRRTNRRRSTSRGSPIARGSMRCASPGAWQETSSPICARSRSTTASRRADPWPRPRHTCAKCWRASRSSSRTRRPAPDRAWTHRSRRSSCARSAPSRIRSTAGRTSHVSRRWESPAVNYGPGDPSLAHHDQERVPIAQIEDVERGLRTWLSS